MTPFNIRASRMGNFAFGLGFYCLAILFILFMKSIWSGVFFFVIGSLGIFQGIDRRPQIVIEENGLTYGPTRKSYVAWTDVNKINITKSRSTNFLELSLNFPEKWWSEKSHYYMPRSSMFSSASIKIPLNLVDTSVEEIKDYLARIGKPVG